MSDLIFRNLPAVDLSEVEERIVERGRNIHFAGLGQGVVVMDKALFSDLVDSLKEASAIRAGKKSASRRTTLVTPHVREVRAQTGLTQAEFARVLQVSVKTLQNWEQERRSPTGPAAALIKIVSAAPDVALKALHA